MIPLSLQRKTKRGKSASARRRKTSLPPEKGLNCFSATNLSPFIPEKMSGRHEKEKGVNVQVLLRCSSRDCVPERLDLSASMLRMREWEGQGNPLGGQRSCFVDGDVDLGSETEGGRALKLLCQIIPLLNHLHLCRLRPFSDEELRNNAPQVVTCNEYQREVAVSQNIAGKQIDRVFTFDKVFGPSAQQKDLYDQAMVPIVNEVLEGFNCTIFAYGQTGTGKTYTMEGDSKKSKSGSKGQLPQDAGVIPRAVKQIFDTLESQNAEYSVKVTFLELYNEEITDLLAPEEISKLLLEEKQKKPLLLMEDGKGGVLVRGLEEEIVTSASEIFTLLERGSAKRRTAETLLNKQSSRSHSLFTITIHIKEATPEGEELIKCGKLNLVDLAGSENISRSGAREGRAREAGEINKSLLTLGRVITALVEHLGHIPYRDSKLTRLLRDSLGGRTKTCIIATVSPSVHCLEETLSTLDYAHRAKHIKNRPEVNQKMMKSTLIKDLYGEIDRLKAEVYAAREKNGVYIPKERYYQEESERKAMAEQIEQMGILLENHQKQLDELQDKYDSQVRQSAELSSKLESTQLSLEKTNDLLATAKEDLKRSKYEIKERDFIIAAQRKAAREDKLNATNRSVVDNFRAELSKKIKALCSTFSGSMSQQNAHLQCVEDICHSCLAYQEKSLIELTKKVAASRASYISHIEGLQNVVRLHKANSNANLEEISSLASDNCTSLDQLLAAESEQAKLIFGDLQNTLANHQGEMAHFARELRERFRLNMEHSVEMSKFITGFLEKLGEESDKLQAYVSRTHEFNTRSIADFQKAYKDKSRSEAEKLVADLTNLVSDHIRRQEEMVDVQLVGLRDAAVNNKAFFDEHASTMEGVTSDAKRKWNTFSMQAENDAKEGADFSAAKHCRMELLFQQCITTVDAASGHWKKMHESVSEMSRKQVISMESVVRNTTESNEQHDQEIVSARAVAEQDVTESCSSILQHFESKLHQFRTFETKRRVLKWKKSNGKSGINCYVKVHRVLNDDDSISEQEQKSVSGIIAAVKAHASTLHKLEDDYCAQVVEMEQQAHTSFQDRYMSAYPSDFLIRGAAIMKDYEPSDTTPIRCEVDVPSKAVIESLRAMPVENLLEEFRENHPYGSASKEPKPSMIPRSPLVQIN
ncbi:Kinesin-like protein KIN-5C [Asimina triloba]